MSATEEEEDDYVIVGPVPGQVGRVLTILALTESASFTDPEHDPLLTKINYSTEEAAAASLLGQKVVKRSGATRKNIVVCLCLWMAYTLCNAAFSIINPFFPQIAAGKGASPILIGLIISSSPLSVVIVSPFIGYFLPYVRVWLQVFLGLLFIGCSYIALGFTDRLNSEWSFVLTCVVLRIIEGLGNAILTTAIFSTFPKLFPKFVGTLVGLFELGAGFGFSLGPTIGGLLFQYGGYKVPFLTIGGIIVIFVLLPCTLLVRKMDVKYEKRTLPSRVIWKLCTNGLFVALILVVVTTYNPGSFFAPSFPTYMENTFNQSSFQIGLLFFGGSLTYLFTALPVGPLTDKVGHHRKFIVFGLLVLTVFLFMLGIPNYYLPIEYQSVWTVRISFSCLDIGCAFCIVPVYSDLLNIGERYMKPGDSKAALSSFVSGLLTSAINLGLVIGPLAGGLLSTFFPVPMCSLLLAELTGAEALLIVGMSLFFKFTGSKLN